jgi:hypothetical protein
MPTYTFKVLETEEIVEFEMKISEYDEFVASHPDLERYHESMLFIDSVRLGIKKPPEDFQKFVIDRIKEKNPHHRMESRWETPREW